MSEKMKIRRKVLNMSYEQWKKLDKHFKLENKKSDEDVFETTPKDFLEVIGLPGALSSYCNEVEKLFFDEIYTLYRSQYCQYN